jgi:hypothetical protein
LTRVLTNVYRGFVPGKNLLREHVEIRPFVLQWASEHSLLRQKERLGHIYGKGIKIKSPIFPPVVALATRNAANADSFVALTVRPGSGIFVRLRDFGSGEQYA